MSRATLSHPTLLAYQLAVIARYDGGWEVDWLNDSTRGRKRKSERLLKPGRGVFSVLADLKDHTLYHVVIHLPPCNPLSLPFNIPWIKSLLFRLFKNLPRYVRLSISRNLLPHVHILLAVPKGYLLPGATFFGSIWYKEIDTWKYLRQLALYFSRPADERAARPNLTKPVDRISPQGFEQMRHDACEDRLKIKRFFRGKRIPRYFWQNNIPKRNKKSSDRSRSFICILCLVILSLIFRRNKIVNYSKKSSLNFQNLNKVLMYLYIGIPYFARAPPLNTKGEQILMPQIYSPLHFTNIPKFN